MLCLVCMTGGLMEKKYFLRPDTFVGGEENAWCRYLSLLLKQHVRKY